MHTRDVQLIDGDRLAAFEETNDGVFTDAGLVRWDEIAGFWSWHKPTSRWMFIPV